ncbi:MAG: VanW family protein [Bacillus sp. (in: firmicutes)]
MKQLCMAIFLFVAQPIEHPNNLTVTQQEQTIATVNRENFTSPLFGTSMINEEKYKQFINKLNQQISQAPINAKINDQGNIIPEKKGYILNKQQFMEQFYEYFFGKGASTIEVPKMEVYPKVDSELLSNIRVQRIGQYVTSFNANNKNRSHNISLAANAIDNYVIFPNETFSFNQVVGMRTTKEGYMRAPIIVKGEFSEGIGGGICQVSSTLFNAVDRAGLKIVQRYSHSRRVSYVPSGRDATVSWYGPDFRFQNKFNQPILIRAKGDKGRMVVTLYSSEIINYKSRNVPSASARLSKETKAKAEMNEQIPY